MSGALAADVITAAPARDIPLAQPPVLGEAPVVVIGGGPAGIRAAQELTRRGIATVVLNAERWQPYNRVKLTPLLCGDAQVGQIMQPLVFPGSETARLYSNTSVIDIDRDARRVTTSTGRIFPYSKLVFATGSRANIPPFDGGHLPGVFTFRNFDDAEKLIARSIRSRCTVVVGGGLLGLEAARGMANRGVKTVVVEHESHLMSRQLDARASALLRDAVEASGLEVHVGTAVRRFVGDERVEAIELGDDTKIACDTIILCTGIRANRELARDVGLSVGRGITVDDTLRTSDPDIYAIGECAEIDGETCGLVGPAFEQATVAARHIAGDGLRYTGALSSTKLKVAGIELFSMGDIEQLEQRSDLTSWIFDADGVYRRLVFSRGRLVGAIAFGEWDEINRVQEQVRRKARLPFWHQYRFISSGRLSHEGASNDVRTWPRAATVCNCTGVTRGQIGDAITLGAATLDDVRRETGANTVCGSCKDHIASLFDQPAPREAVSGAGALKVLGAIALVIALLTLIVPAWPLAEAVMDRGLPEWLWLDGFWKQVSGYTVLALSCLAALLSLRKRVSWLRLGDYGIWRIVHLGVGIAAVAVLALHTGFRLGANLNAWLMLSFLALIAAGGIAGLAIALEHRLFATPPEAARARSLSFWLHLLAFWPIPVLLTVHILSVYFY